MADKNCPECGGSGIVDGFIITSRCSCDWVDPFNRERLNAVREAIKKG